MLKSVGILTCHSLETSFLPSPRMFLNSMSVAEISEYLIHVSGSDVTAWGSL